MRYPVPDDCLTLFQNTIAQVKESAEDKYSVHNFSNTNNFNPFFLMFQAKLAAGCHTQNPVPKTKAECGTNSCMYSDAPSTI